MAADKQINTVRRSIKRKLDDSFTVIDTSSSQQQHDDDLLIKIRELIQVLETNSSDRALIKRSIQILSELAKNGINLTCYTFLFEFLSILYLIACYWYGLLSFVYTD